MSNKKHQVIIKEMLAAFNNRDLDEWSKYFDKNALDFVPSFKEPISIESPLQLMK